MSDDIGIRIKQARLSAKMTQKELASQVGVPYQTVQFWENGKRHPKIENVRKIAEVLNVEWYDLYEGIDQERVNQEAINEMKWELGYDELENQKNTGECPKWDENDKVFADFLELNASGQYIALQTVLEILDRRLKHSTALKFKYFVDLLRNEAYDSIKNILTPDETVNNYAFEALREVYDRVHELTNIPSCQKNAEDLSADNQKADANETRWYR